MPHSRRAASTPARETQAAPPKAAAIGRRPFLGAALALLAAPRWAQAAPAGPPKIDLSKLDPYWNEIPDSAFARTGASRAILGAWNGAAYAPSLRKLFIPAAGGHSDYDGNDVYSFSLDTFRWLLEKPSAKVVGMTRNGINIMEEGPVSRHLYGGVQWMADLDKFVIAGAGPAKSAVIAADNWTYDPAAKAYRQLPDSVLGSIIVYDEARGLCFSPSEGSMRVRNMRTGTVGRLPVRMYHSAFGCGDYDPVRHVFAWLSGGMISLADLTDPGRVGFRGYCQTKAAEAAAAAGGWSRVYPLLPNIAPEDVLWQGSGVAYEPRREAFLCWSGGRDVMVLDHKRRTPTITRISTPPDRPIPPAGGPNGIFGRWRYVAAYDCFIAVPTNVNSNMWLYKLPN